MVQKRKPLDTLWEVPDELWARIEPILWENAPPPKNPGRPRADWRRLFNGIIFRLRTGCHWNKLPKEFGDDSTVHRWFQRWCRHGVMEKIWAVLMTECDELGAVYWRWQSADGAMGKARFGGKKGRQKPHGPRKKRDETQFVGGPARRAFGGSYRRGQCARHQVVASYHRSDRRRAAETDSEKTAALVSGQRL